MTRTRKTIEVLELVATTSDAQEYDALGRIEQAGYDLLGQRGYSHNDCMAGARELAELLTKENVA